MRRIYGKRSRQASSISTCRQVFVPERPVIGQPAIHKKVSPYLHQRGAPAREIRTVSPTCASGSALRNISSNSFLLIAPKPPATLYSLCLVESSRGMCLRMHSHILSTGEGSARPRRFCTWSPPCALKFLERYKLSILNQRHEGMCDRSLYKSCFSK